MPFVTTPKWVIEKFVDKIDLKNNSIVYDLGCGDAKVLFALEKKFPNLKLIGYELAWWPYVVAKLKIKLKKSKIKILHQNFYKANFSDADIIFCYLIDTVMPKLESQLKIQLKPGAKVFSYGFKFPNWQPAEIIPNPLKPKGSKINFYQK